MSEWRPSRVEVDAVEATLQDSLDDGGANRAPDGYYRPLAEACLIKAHEAWETLHRLTHTEPTMNLTRATRMVHAGESFSPSQLDELRKLDGVDSLESEPVRGDTYRVTAMQISVGA